ncbi:hypothetical protein [Oscillatoria sp. FACHB-1406]|uniref:hypothetical protein n=1 Tax=Oscillatoria sp. FACHB-1406 TaxID=2692846 RepID=UPI001686D476|nr:hypothetical protein [Oscillatoria sp. FACHB-1406]MBD2577661.1 hypothetical protein [Oscillatoria sp. FACHB-1406]
MTSRRSPTSTLGYLFLMVLGLTILVYLLRGFGVLTFIPGGVIWILMLLSLASGLLYLTEKMRRF